MALTPDEIADNLLRLSRVGEAIVEGGAKVRDDAEILRRQVEAARLDGGWTPEERRRVARQVWRLGQDAAKVTALAGPVVANIVKDALD